jgi:hypothetical protein
LELHKIDLIYYYLRLSKQPISSIEMAQALREEGECIHELNIYQPGEPDAEMYDQSIKQYGDFIFQKRGSKNMDILYRHFHLTESYPEYYTGISKKIAICKCTKTGAEEWHNGERLLSSGILNKGSIVTLTINIKGRIYTRDFIFTGWVKTPVHEWRMTNGNTLHLEQAFVDGLLPQDKRYLKMTR